MNKTELVATVAEVSGKPKADVKEVLEALLGQIIKTVKSGEEVSLVGFGTFKSAERAARTGRNPATGK
ncbi:HU family DNA-binding protein, partial [Parasutterella excrementihominis]